MAELEKVLSFRTILIITINSIMGTGVFFLPAIGAKTAGPASIVSWLIMSIISIYIGMCFAELSSMFPKAGGVYEFCKQAYGKFPSFLIGWGTFIAGNITLAMLVVGAIQYLVPVNVPYFKIGISLFFVLIFNYIAFKGMKTSSVMLVTFGFITMGTLFALIIPNFVKLLPGFIKLSTQNFTPFFPFPATAIFIAIFLIAETFFGWETATFLAEETKDGQKVMPKALILGTIVIAIICLLFVVSSIGFMGWQTFGDSVNPLSDLGMMHFGAMGRDIFVILVYLSIIGSVAGWVVSAPRLIFAMAQDQLFPKHFTAIHEKNKTPYKAIIFQAIVASILVVAGFGSYTTLLHLLVPIVIILYSLVLLSLTILRFTKPEVTRYYKVPLGKVGPSIVVVFLIAMVAMWALKTHGAFNIILLGASFILLGLPVYFLIEMYYNPKAIQKVNDFFAYVTLYTEKTNLPVAVRKEVFELLGDIKGKRVLEYGCSVGTLTRHLAHKVGPNGRIYATNLSLKELKIADNRLKKLGFSNVRLIHDDQHALRVNPLVPRVDAIVSIGTLGSVQDVKKVLKELHDRLDDGGRFCFLDYDKFFHIIPTVEWLAKDEKAKEVFKECGYLVNIKRTKGLFFEHVFVYGVKSGRKGVVYI